MKTTVVKLAIWASLGLAAPVEPAAGTHQVLIAGRIQWIAGGQIGIQTPRQELCVTIHDGTRIRVGDREGRRDELRVGQLVTCASQMQDGIMLCQELRVLTPGELRHDRHDSARSADDIDDGPARAGR